MTPDTGTVSDVDSDSLFDPAVIADPYPFFARLREQDPVHWNAPFQLWVITRYEDVVWMIRNHELFLGSHPQRPPAAAPADRS